MLLPLELNMFPRTKDVYIVGGSIRDLLDGRIPVDYDLAVQDDPAGFARRLASRTAGHVIEFGKGEQTILRVVGADHIFDIMPFNGISIEEDLRRRDFTINAMALDLSSGNLVDPVDGRSDLAAKKIRMVSSQVFKSDPVRLIRAYRMAAAFDFTIDANTEAAIARQADLIRNTAAERIREEFFKILHAAGSYDQIVRMGHSGLLFSVFPEFRQLKTYHPAAGRTPDFFEQTLAAYAYLENLLNQGCPVSAGDGSRFSFEMDAAKTVLIKWAVLFHKIGIPQIRKVAADGTFNHYGYAANSAAMARLICQRLRFSRRQVDYLSFIIRLHRRPFSLYKQWRKSGRSDREYIRFFMKCTDAVVDILLLGLAELFGTRGPGDPAVADFTGFISDRIRHYETVLRLRMQRPLAINGNDLIRHFGLKPSPDFKYILKRLQEEHLAGGDLTRSQALELVKALLDRVKNPGSEAPPARFDFTPEG